MSKFLTDLYATITGMSGDIILRLAGNGLGLWVAERLSTHVNINGGFWAIALAAVIFTAVNLVVRPLTKLFTLPLIILTLGLFSLIINVLMVFVLQALDNNFMVTGFWAAAFVTIIVSLVNYAVNVVFHKD